MCVGKSKVLGREGSEREQENFGRGVIQRRKGRGKGAGRGRNKIYRAPGGGGGGGGGGEVHRRGGKKKEGFFLHKGKVKNRGIR